MHQNLSVKNYICNCQNLRQSSAVPKNMNRNMKTGYWNSKIPLFKTVRLVKITSVITDSDKCQCKLKTLRESLLGRKQIIWSSNLTQQVTLWLERGKCTFTIDMKSSLKPSNLTLCVSWLDKITYVTYAIFLVNYLPGIYREKQSHFEFVGDIIQLAEMPQK